MNTVAKSKTAASEEISPASIAACEPGIDTAPGRKNDVAFDALFVPSTTR